MFHPSGQVNVGDDARRSTATTVLSVVQPPAGSAASVAFTSSTGRSYGGSANTRSTGSPRPGASTAATGRTSTVAPVSPSESTLRSITAAVRGFASTNVARAAPRDNASSPNAPDPA